MMRFYHLTDKECMDMPINRFIALYKRIKDIQLEEEARELTIVHNGKPNDRLTEILKLLRLDYRPKTPSASMMLSLNTPGVRQEQESGYIEKLRERQVEANRRNKLIWEAEKAGLPPPVFDD